jgi:Tol biopolymer transport system component
MAAFYPCYASATMRRSLLAACLFALPACPESEPKAAPAGEEAKADAKEPDAKEPDADEASFAAQEKHLSSLRQLTDGGENAEAYLSFDQQRLVFQSTRDGSECDQIFIMGIDGSDQKRVSSGKGRTTCAYFLPGDTRILYASTHAADDGCLPPPDRSHGYVWKLYDEFDIYTANADGSDSKPLLTGKGYDAEATVSPKGDKIVFTSTRDGDPEIYVAGIDGKNVQRLTNVKGYDGGPFFNADGTKIVYRANHPEGDDELAKYDEILDKGLVRPTRLEIFVMNADGSEQTQVTKNGKANFAPFWHPDGKRIIFASNMDDPQSRNFDLYLIGADGSGLERVTYNPTFDGFPMFTSDGKQLVFASNRDNAKEGDTNIFVAEWTD